jgi:hypothetical protein
VKKKKIKKKKEINENFMEKFKQINRRRRLLKEEEE